MSGKSDAARQSASPARPTQATAQETIAAAQLPDPLPDLALRTIRRTRLWRSEQRDIARELVAHFQDGLQAGRDAAGLARDFGDADQAARLIRRAKKRNRPRWWKATRFAGYGMMFLIAFYAALAVRFFTGSPTIAVDYVAELNRGALAVGEEERAWPLYREALLLIEEAPEDADWPGPPGAAPEDPHWPQYAAYLERNAEALALARRAAAKPHMGFVAGYGLMDEMDLALWPEMDLHHPPDSTISMHHVLLPYLGDARRLAQLLAADARRAALAGDGAMAVENLFAMLGIAGHVRELPTVINDLVAIAVLSLALNETGALLAEHPEVLPDEGLVDLAHGITAALSGGDIRIRFDGERMFFEDFVQRIYTDDGRGGGRLTPRAFRAMVEIQMASGTDQGEEQLGVLEGVLGPGAMLVLANRRQLMRKHDRMYEMMEREAALPLWRREASEVEAELQRMVESPIERIRNIQIVLLMPALMRATINAELATQKRDATLVAIALELHRRHHGRWPEQLDDLVPRYLPAVPPDRFDGRPIRYALIDGEPVVYSIGNNREDHGGTPPPRKADGTLDTGSIMRWRPADAADRHGEGDWVLWPPVE